jgi:hypothetical protein
LDEFADHQNNWTGDGSSPNLSWTANIIHDHYEVILSADKGEGNVWYPFVPRKMGAINDFYYAVDIKINQAPQDNLAAMIFRFMGEENYYSFDIKTDLALGPVFRVRRFLPGSRDNLIEWMASPYLNAGETNRLAVIGIGSEFQFYINGYCVASKSDSTYPTGIIGVFGRLSQPNDVLDLEFDNVEVRLPTDFGNVACP